MENVATTMWQKSKLLIKGLLIGALVLLLMIPTYFVQNLIKEREARQKEAFKEVSTRWAGKQNLTGPILMIPYLDSQRNGNGVTILSKKMAYFLPDVLKIDASVKPEERHRGIFQVMLYSSEVKLSGRFDPLPIAELGIAPESLLWDQAQVGLMISDARGLKDGLSIQWNNVSVPLNPSRINDSVVKDGFGNNIPVAANQPVDFSTTIRFNGSEQLLFTPVGKETSVKLSSSWPDPSFNGEQLPDYLLNDTGFTASWRSMAHTRHFPQAWKDNNYSLQASSFGADLFIPVNGYQKTLRSVKYAILCILLTFAAFFLIETVNKRSVHPFQYALIGLALILFYTLLLSFSEYTGFNVAYIISAVATIGLIGWFVKGLLQSGRLSLVLSTILVLIYSYVFTILQLEDFALLLGSVGLFLTLGVIMYFSRRISW